MIPNGKERAGSSGTAAEEENLVLSATRENSMKTLE
jgi:hypothetical protein